jgi:hypothetical protein
VYIKQGKEVIIMAISETVQVGQSVLTDLSVEELEQRLEMQMIALPDADWCIGNCDSQSGGCNGEAELPSSL